MVAPKPDTCEEIFVERRYGDNSPSPMPRRKRPIEEQMLDELRTINEKLLLLESRRVWLTKALTEAGIPIPDFISAPKPSKQRRKS